MNRRVRVNNLYRFNPNGWDLYLPAARLNHADIVEMKAGKVVRVINLPGAQKANTMGQCYVADPKTGRFLCMVSTGSLTPVISRVHRIRAVNMAKAILNGVDAGDFSLTAARDAMEDIASCPESVRVTEVG
jgi:hypothetical protein